MDGRAKWAMRRYFTQRMRLNEVRPYRWSKAYYSDLSNRVQAKKADCMGESPRARETFLLKICKVSRAKGGGAAKAPEILAAVGRSAAGYIDRFFLKSFNFTFNFYF